MQEKVSRKFYKQQQKEILQRQKSQRIIISNKLCSHRGLFLPRCVNFPKNCLKLTKTNKGTHVS